MSDNSADVSEKIIWSNVIGLTLSWIVWNPFQNAIWTYWQVFLYALGATPFIIALISAVSQLILSISRIPGGYITDKVGRRILIVSMTYIIALTYLMMYFAQSWEFILIASVISSVALFYQPALNAIIADSLPKEKRGRGFAVINILPSIVIVFSPYIAYIYVSKFGIVEGTRQLLLLSFITGVIAATIRLALLKETMRVRTKMPRNFLKDLKMEYGKAIRIVIRAMKFLLIGYMLVGIAIGLSYLIQLYALKYLLIDTESWAYIQIISFVLYLVLAFPFSIATDKIGRKPPILIACLTSMVAYLIVAIAPIGDTAVLYILVSTILGSIAWALVSSAIPAMEADLLPHEIRGKGYAIINLINSLVIASAQLISGALYTTLGPRFPFYLSATFWLASFIAFLKIPETLCKEKESTL